MGCFVKFGAISMVIRQKDESQNGDNKKVKHAKFSEKRTFLTPWYAHVHVRTCAYQVVTNVHFLFAFLLPPFWDSPFCLITDHLYNLKNVTKSNTPPSVFFAFFMLYIWYQIVQRIINALFFSAAFTRNLPRLVLSYLIPFCWRIIFVSMI